VAASGDGSAMFGGGSSVTVTREEGGRRLTRVEGTCHAMPAIVITKQGVAYHFEDRRDG